MAEDIGKFPDTNLAESMRRIAGVSIDRNASGEGNRVTVRGVGPDFNLVLLNGRQMPVAPDQPVERRRERLRVPSTSRIWPQTRSRPGGVQDFARLVPTGGIGATINVKTASA